LLSTVTSASAISTGVSTFSTVTMAIVHTSQLWLPSGDEAALVQAGSDRCLVAGL